MFFFFNDTATTEIYTLSLHDALPIWSTPDGPRSTPRRCRGFSDGPCGRKRIDDSLSSGVSSGNYRFVVTQKRFRDVCDGDRKSTRLNSSHANISYAVFCLKKKKHVISYHSKRLLDEDQFLLFQIKHSSELNIFGFRFHHRDGGFADTHARTRVTHRPAPHI